MCLLQSTPGAGRPSIISLCTAFYRVCHNRLYSITQLKPLQSQPVATKAIRNSLCVVKHTFKNSVFPSPYKCSVFPGSIKAVCFCPYKSNVFTCLYNQYVFYCPYESILPLCPYNSSEFLCPYKSIEFTWEKQFTFLSVHTVFMSPVISVWFAFRQV